MLNKFLASGSRNLKIKILASLGLTLVLALPIQLFSLELNKDLHETQDLVSHTHEVMLKLEDINTGLTVLESNTRGYVISRNTSFLANHSELKISILAKLATIQQLTSDNPSQQQKIDQIRPYINAKVKFTDSTIKHDEQTGIAMISSGYGKQLMDTIREQLKGIEQTEIDLLQQRMEESEELSDYVNIINIITTLLIVLVILAAVVFIFIDINKREILESELRENESRLKQFFEALPIGITVRDAAGDLFFTNKQGRDTLHKIFQDGPTHNLQQLVKDHRVIKAGTDELYPLEEMPVMKALTGSSSMVDNIEIRNHDNSILLSEMASPVYNSQQEIVYAIAAFDDITNRKKEEFELKQAKKAAEESSLAKERFLANMSHEIRTPMNAILGFTNLLHRSPLDAEQQQFVEAIRSSGENLLTIINDILDVSKIQAGMMQLEEIPFGLKPLFESLQVLLQNSAHDKSLKLTINCQEQVPWLLIGDPVRLTQIMYNLIQNAIKFTSKGGVSVDARVKEQDLGQSWIEITVSDTGIGISQDKLDSIFERFSQATTTTTREFGGTGLGLTIVKSLIELQGGKISIDSVLGKGSIFTVLLPYKNASENDLILYSEQSHLEAGTVQLKLHVLVAEDNLLNQKLAYRVLSDMGFTVEIASNGSEAVELLKSGKHFDVILMDIQMPVMDGYEATSIIREQLTIDIPIMAMTAHAMSGEKEKCIAFGMNDYLSKPFKANELQSKIYMLLGADAASSETEFSPVVPAPTIYDLSYLINMSGGNTDFVKEMVNLFLTHTPIELDKLKQAVEGEQLAQVVETAHKLKSSVAMMGIKSMAEGLSQLEKRAKISSGLNTLKPLYEEVARIGETAIDELVTWSKAEIEA
ncbi:signal transduction histidine kinase/CHASE3 domain sensor protein/DNA-binding response OmpR family regulator [Pontibacter aydingkolensis]|uniref:histidine kinase n=1 Tax=Pontibacter aydingkolensis TaxID=1911536 RepID=A0ABS7CSE9_9BACT|nr:CHASE3 domain-containing protein [Pontibacter aydingkolensis]MBW7466710.1 CHASE3 domain-containing protein [Pontibacter aydingkolensis]